MKTGKIAVISTSQAQPEWYMDVNWRTHEEDFYKSGAVLAKWSDFFDRLLVEGYEIFVFSSRAKLGGPWDYWNTKVDSDHIFLADTSVSCGEEHKTGGCECYQRNLWKIYARLGLALPIRETTYWPNLHYGLKNFGVVTCEADLPRKEG